jgi:oligopeptide/dipeptide ABC transporter ATP-binding protein
MPPIPTRREAGVTDSTQGSEDIVLQVEDLHVRFDTHEGEVPAVNGVSFRMRRGRTMALVGESGCGKSVTSYAILRIVQEPGRIAGGAIRFRPRDGGEVDIAALHEGDEALYRLRGGRIGMVFQEPMTALSPVHTVGDQIGEAVRLHDETATPEAARQRAVDMLRRVGIPGPEQRVDQYPFEMSGGMRQRVVIAMALACRPDVLIADEPTTALDVTIQAQILGLLKDLQQDLGASTLLITHDLGVVAQLADDVCVMYLGRVVEQADVRTVMKRPRHPYTRALLQSLPGSAARGSRLPSIEGSVPSPTQMPAGCPFHPRCPHARVGLCDTGGPPAMEPVSEGHAVACVRLHDEDLRDTGADR